MRESIFLVSVEHQQLYANFQKTVEKKVNIKNLSQFEIPTKIRSLKDTAIWGFNPTSENKSLWKKMRSGDIVLFLRNKKYFQMGTIQEKIQNLEIPKKFWHGDIYGQSRSLLIFIDKLKQISLNFDSTIPIFIKPTMPESYHFPIIKINTERQKILYKIFGTFEKTIDFLSNNVDVDNHVNETEIELKASLSKIRKGQEKFRNHILNNFYSKCAVCEISEKDLLQASHIISVAQKQTSGSLKNGICLCVLHHLMFDRGYFSFDDEYKIIIHKQKFSSDILLTDMQRFRKMGKSKILPSLDFLRLHRARYDIY